MAEASAIPPRRRIGTVTMLAYALGAVAYGVKDNGFSTFLLLFYNQVLGLPSAIVGAVVMAALLFDAVIDPAVGFLSDHTRSRWGRRHPWMYAAALPVALAWLLLWSPPALGQGAMLLWLFVFAVMLRSAVSAYEVPSVALTPELTADYDERTRIMAWRYLLGWAGGLAMLVAAYGVFLGPANGGLLGRAGYGAFGVAGAIAMAGCIFISAIGTHHEIPRLPRAVPHAGSLGAAFRELRETVRNRAFAILMAAGLCYYTAQGISFALSNYLYAYVWRMQGNAYVALGGVLFVGVVAAFLIAPACAKRWGKPVTACVFMIAAALLLALPYALRIVGLFPDPASPAMLPLLFGIFAVNTAFGVGATMLGSSMMADVVEHSEAETGRRSEGVFFAGAFFVQKCTSGLGIFAASMILTLAAFPDNGQPGRVPIATLDHLTLLFSGAYLALGFLAAWLYARFPFGKAEHEARLARLAAEG